MSPLLGRSATRDVADAVVAVTAARLAAVVLTADRADLEHLFDAGGLGVPELIDV